MTHASVFYPIKIFIQSLCCSFPLHPCLAESLRQWFIKFDYLSPWDIKLNQILSSPTISYILFFREDPLSSFLINWFYFSWHLSKFTASQKANRLQVLPPMPRSAAHWSHHWWVSNQVRQRIPQPVQHSWPLGLERHSPGLLASSTLPIQIKILLQTLSNDRFDKLVLVLTKQQLFSFCWTRWKGNGTGKRYEKNKDEPVWEFYCSFVPHLWFCSTEVGASERKEVSVIELWFNGNTPTQTNF